MLRLLSIFGGLLIHYGATRSFQSLLIYFCLEDQVPETDLLRLIDKHIGFEFVPTLNER